MDLSTRVKRSAIGAGVSVVRSARQGPFSSFCSAACTAASIGTLVNSDSTSKDTMISLSRVVSLLTMDTKRAELVTVCSEFPVKEDKMLARQEDKSYAKVFRHDTIGLSGTSAL